MQCLFHGFHGHKKANLTFLFGGVHHDFSDNNCSVQQHQHTNNYLKVMMVQYLA